MRSGSPAPDREQNLKWRVPDLLRGITPKSMLEEWSSVFRSPKSIAQTVLYKFVGFPQPMTRPPNTLVPGVIGLAVTATLPATVFVRVALR